MAEALTNIQEPGFFSQVQESPSLFLSPATINVVGLIGTGSATKSTSQSIVRGATGYSDALALPVSSVVAISSDSVYQFPLSSFGLAVSGTEAQPVGGWTGISGMTISAKVGEVIQTHTIGITGDALVGDIVNEINADINVTQFSAVATLDNRLQLVSADGQAIVMEAGTANVVFGFETAQIADAIYWDPGIVDGSLRPASGTSYKVEYLTPKVAADFKPAYYFGSRQVLAAYGDLVVENSLCMGANAAFSSGASVVVCRQIDPAKYADLTQRKAEIAAALTDLENTTANIIVPMIPVTDDLATIPMYLNHVSKMSSKLEKKERMAILGVDERDGALPVYGSGNAWENIKNYFDVSASSGLKPRRIIMVAPGKASITSTVGTTLVADGTYVAAAMAGRMVSAEFDEATPMTRKTLPTIESMMTVELNRADKNILTSWGITVVEMKSGIATIRRAVTADTSSIAAQEPSIVRSFDRIAMELRNALEEKYVGTKIVPLLNRDIEASTQTLLNRFVSEEIIGGFRNIKAVQNAVEPRQFDISFEGIPVFPFLWGFIDISITLG